MFFNKKSSDVEERTIQDQGHSDDQVSTQQINHLDTGDSTRQSAN